MESPLAVSSVCRKCGAYLSFVKGQVRARPREEIESKVKELDPSTPEPPVEKKESPKAPPQPQLDLQKAQDHQPSADPQSPLAQPHQADPDLDLTPISRKFRPPKNAPALQKPPVSKPTKAPETTPDVPVPVPTPEPSPAPVSPAPEPAPKSQSFLQKLSGRSTEPVSQKERLAICFECGDSHLANALSNSTQCRKCGRMISLQSHDIKTVHTSRIQTRGDVFIHKKGVVTGESIQCHHLTIEGEFTGNVECSGDLTMRRNGKVSGNVVCQRLLVERRSKVEFLAPVETNECSIDGLITGNITCRGKLSLEKRATLTGDIKVKSLTISDGAKHTGQIQMGGF